MTIRQAAIDKQQNLPEPLLRQVSEFIDFLTYTYQKSSQADMSPMTSAETWARWFESVDQIQVGSAESMGDFQKHLLAKYRKQGLEL